MSQMQDYVEDFHNALELPARSIPQLLPDDERKLRANLIFEEATELLQALGFEMLVNSENDSIYLAPTIQPSEPVANQVKEMCDLLYVVFGTAVTMGIELEPFFRAVHENNMTKVGGERRADGKRMKPPGYTPVNLMHRMSEYLKQHCPTCQKYDNSGPNHFASPYCLSGRYNHCSCDTCF